MPVACKKLDVRGFGWLTEKRETYHRDVAGERADRARGRKLAAAEEKQQTARLLEELKDDAKTAGANDKRAGRKLTPYRLDLITSPRYEEAFGKQRARELVTAAYRNPAVSTAATTDKSAPEC